MKPTTNRNVILTRSGFDETFKLDAAQNRLSSGKSAEEIAEELGINSQQLYAWKKRLAPAEAGGRAELCFDWDLKMGHRYSIHILQERPFTDPNLTSKDVKQANAPAYALRVGPGYKLVNTLMFSLPLTANQSACQTPASE